MKHILFSVVITLAISSVAIGQYKKGSVEDQLIQLDKAWTFAELKGDKKAAADLIAEDYVGTTQRGEIENKAQYLASVVPNADMVKSDEYRIAVYGNTAIMTHRATVEGVRNIQFRSTHVWMKRNGKWQIVAHHGSRIEPPDEEGPDDAGTEN
ncbi:MAG: nuclear transport factor 2 family protein [Pyrinomonadaceae bacterium]